MAVLAGKGDSLDGVVDQVLASKNRVYVERSGAPAAVVLSTRDLDGLEYSIDLLSEPRTVRRVLEGEAALQAGNSYMGEELSVLDPEGRYVVRSVSAGTSLAPTAGARSHDGWGLVASVPAQRALDGLPLHVANVVRDFVFGRLLADPLSAGFELHGFLSRRMAARIETALVLYRLDSVKHLVRLVEVLNLGGLVGHQENQHW